jgi:mono/diheme cytochrome c family protein
MPEHEDPDLEKSTRQWMWAGVVLMALFIVAFPVYQLYEPGARAVAREQQLADLRAEGQNVYVNNCGSCHGPDGEGVDAPALNSKQFLDDVTEDQITSIVAHGIPGSGMVAWSVDYGGPLTSEQIDAVASYLDSWRPDAPDRPDWRTPEG